MVKDEQKGIGRAIKSALPLIDECVISIDETTTDNTQEEIEKVCHDAKIFIHKWTDDFSRNRNQVLEKCSGDYILVLDGDEVIEDGINRLLELKKENFKDREILRSTVTHINNDGIHLTSLQNGRLFKSHIRYQHRVHETLNYTGDNVEFVPEFKIYNYGAEGNEDKSKYYCELTRLEYEENPDDLRALFQLAHLYMGLRDYKKAAECFEIFLEKSDFKPAIYQAKVKLAQCYHYFGRRLECEYLLRGSEMDNIDKRNLHYVVLGEYFMRNEVKDEARRWFQKAIDTPKPVNYYFLYPENYYKTPLAMMGRL